MAKSKQEQSCGAVGDATLDAESQRLVDADAGAAAWRRWGPYLADRQWGTVREDYSPDGDCWSSFPHDHARSRAYRWGEDGLLGICDDQCRLCFAPALWNGKDPILKERLFGLTGPEGNHGEDVKEQYFHLDSTPTHSYMSALYKYPQSEFPYRDLVEENRRRGKWDAEYELEDTGAFDEGRYHDVLVEYAKEGPEDLAIRITVSNRGDRAAAVHLLPQLWFRNTWSWGEGGEKPVMRLGAGGEIVAEHPALGRYVLAAESGSGATALFTENESNSERLWGVASRARYTKDAFHRCVVNGERDAVNPEHAGTKAGLWWVLDLPAGASATLSLRLCRDGARGTDVGAWVDAVMRRRQQEADVFYTVAPRSHGRLPVGEALVTRRAAAGLLWSKKFYHIDVRRWLSGDPGQPKPPDSRYGGRNAQWEHLNNADVISMPDGWEYPWYAAWDLAFHAVALAKLDPGFAKEQLVLLLREWYTHPNGQIPAYEFAFGDVNPPVHAWAVWRVYKMTGERGRRDRVFLARCFQKLLMNFTWWVNRKDPEGRNLFSGGFLGLDNIGVFDRSRPLPTGGHLEQADGTAWMAFYCGTMLSMALELAQYDPAYEDVATKFFEHFIAIADAINTLGGTGLWDEADGFYYDQIRAEGRASPLRVRSLVGLVPMLAVEVLDGETIDRLPDFKRRMSWFLRHRGGEPWASECACAHGAGAGRRLLAIPSRERLERVVGYLIDEKEFLSRGGIRSVSRHHADHPFVLNVGGEEFRVDYAPGESTTALFGGNSNWRGPVWFPLNFLIVEALERYHLHYGDELTVPAAWAASGRVTLRQAADEVRRRLVSIFLPDGRGCRPCHGGAERFASDPHWKDLLLFHEYFHGDSGRGLGASHQTGWTALVMNLIAPSAAGRRDVERKPMAGALA